MFETLTKGFRAARNRLSGLTELTEENLDQALRDVRLSLLEADVELNVAKRFLEHVKEKAVGEVIRTSVQHKGKKVRIGPEERFIKICQDELERMMRADGKPLTFAPKSQATGIMMVGLQGSGKTTSSAKLAGWLEREGRKPLLVAADTQRPGAVEQLQVLGGRLNVPVFAIPGGRPIDICQKAVEHARKLRRDTIVYDTAGRLAIDEALMNELSEIKEKTKPQNVFLVVDAMIGQDSVKTASAFNDKLGLTGVVLTKLDGDARGGAAISVKEATGAPITFVGLGEGLDRIEPFRADGMASRILGFGDVVGLMKDFEAVVDEQKAEADAKRLLQGQFTFDDFLEQIQMLQKMGPLQDVFEKLPFFPEGMPQGMSVNDQELVRVQAIVHSMTKQERRDVELFQRQPTRVRRIAKGSGRTEKEVVELIQRFVFMRQMLGNIGQQASVLSKVPGMKQLAMARRLKDAVKTTGLEANPMMANLAESLLEAAVIGDAAPKTKALAKKQAIEKDRRKQLRKMQKKARKKSRR